MDHAIDAKLLCNTGLLFRYQDSAILVDALNGAIGSFYEIPDETARQIIAGEGEYAKIDGLFYSHLHPDHYNQEKNEAFLRRHPDVTAFFPTPETQDHGILHAGAFTVEYQYLEHVPCDYVWAKHYVLLVSAGGVRVYLTSDAALDIPAHRAFLNGRRADYAFWNAMYLSYAQTRRLMEESARKNFIYHVPVPAADRSGICRKIERNYQRFSDQLQEITLLERYPEPLTLTP